MPRQAPTATPAVRPAAAAPKGAPRLELHELLQMAVRMHRDGHLDNAEKLYQSVLGPLPDQPDALHFLGVLTHQRGRSLEALALLRRSVALVPQLPDWHNNLGNVLLELGRVDEAATAYEEAARLAPARADILNNLGVLRREQGRLQEAEQVYRQVIALDERYIDAYTNLGNVLVARGRSDEALLAYCQGLVLRPDNGRARRALGMAYYSLRRFDEAAQVYRDWLRDEPGNSEARHHLAACSGQDVPGRAADAYVESVFDGFADSFDAKLAHLHYRAPQLIAQAVQAQLGAPDGGLAVLDAGCGTGLCGPLLRPYARRLDGVDLSAGMLAKARPRQVYDRLDKAELTAWMQAAPAGGYGLVVSADTLCYFGALHEVLAAAAHVMAAGGWLVFTVEAMLRAPEGAPADSPGYCLQAHGRYAHREDHVRAALAAAGLAPHQLAHVHLRMEGGKPVDGYLVAARKEAPGAACEAAPSRSS